MLCYVVLSDSVASMLVTVKRCMHEAPHGGEIAREQNDLEPLAQIPAQGAHQRTNRRNSGERGPSDHATRVPADWRETGLRDYRTTEPTE